MKRALVMLLAFSLAVLPLGAQQVKISGAAKISGAVALAKPASGGGAITYVSEGHNDSGSATTLTITKTISAGDDAVVSFTVTDSTVSITSVLDNNAVAYGVLGSVTHSSGLKTWAYGKIDAPAATSITITYGSALVSNGTVFLFTGVSSFGNVGSNIGTDSTNPTLSVTTQDANNYIACMFGQSDIAAATAENGTIRVNNFGLNQGSRFNTSITNTAASPGSVTCSYTIGTARSYAGLGVELRNPAAASAGHVSVHVNP
jgi:hypothetical protein